MKIPSRSRRRCSRDPLEVAERNNGWAAVTLADGYQGSSRPTRSASRCRRTAPTSWSSRRRPTAISAPGCRRPGLRTEPLAAARRKASGEAIAETALMFLGAPYQWGGVTVVGLDCSGLVQAVHRRFGLLLPRNADQQETAGREVSLRSAQPGDLLCYGDHIAIYLGGGEIVHATEDRGQGGAGEASGRAEGAPAHRAPGVRGRRLIAWCATDVRRGGRSGVTSPSVMPSASTIKVLISRRLVGGGAGRRTRFCCAGAGERDDARRPGRARARASTPPRSSRWPISIC